MRVAVLNQTIRAICPDLVEHGLPSRHWKDLTEEELLYEATVCIFGSQVVFEMALASADRLRELGLIQPGLYDQGAVEFERRVAEALAEPLLLNESSGTQRHVRPRFRNRLASLLTSTILETSGPSNGISDLLSSAASAKEARELLTQHIWGFGPKQASLFLRRIGYCADLAVLDVHVLDYLQLAHGVSLSRNTLSRLASYEKIEEMFREIAEDFGYSLGCVDLATWLTMRVAKREDYI